MKILERTIRATTLVSLPAILFLAFSPAKAAAQEFRTDRGNFRNCASSLVADGIGAEAAAIACADVLNPEELSSCVSDIQGNTEVAAEQALLSCYQVRRPEDLASCVVDLNNNIVDVEPSMALDNCRRSLLPIRYADCTLGLQSEIPDLSATEAMENCISVEYFPNQFSPESE